MGVSVTRAMCPRPWNPARPANTLQPQRPRRLAPAPPAGLGRAALVSHRVASPCPCRGLLFNARVPCRHPAGRALALLQAGPGFDRLGLVKPQLA